MLFHVFFFYREGKTPLKKLVLVSHRFDIKLVNHELLNVGHLGDFWSRNVGENMAP